MNTEQLRKEFEAWYFNRRKEWREQGIELSDADANSMWDGYQAAAKSRDELIGKLVDAFEQKVKETPVGSECPQKGASYYNWGKYYLTILKGLVVEAKAKGYGE